MHSAAKRPIHHCFIHLLHKPRFAVRGRSDSAASHFSSSARCSCNAADFKLQPADTTNYRSLEQASTKSLKLLNQQKRHRDTLMQLKISDMMPGPAGQREPSQGVNGASPAATSTTKTKGRQSKHAKRFQKGSSQVQPSAQDPTLPQKLSASQRREVAPRIKPSAESGGVPDPSPFYLASALPPPSTLARPRRILVVMDLNGTLLFRPSKKRPFDFFERPHARDFMNYCLNTFVVAIWSSARPANVNKMVERLLPPSQHSKCVVTWARDQFGLSEEDYDMRVQCYKRLTRIWGDHQVMASHPDAVAGVRWDQTNTVLVDDSSEKGRSEPYNILQIPEFSGVQNEPANVLPQVHDYLNQLSYQADISRFMRQNPFTLDPNYTLAQCGSS